MHRISFQVVVKNFFKRKRNDLISNTMYLVAELLGNE